MRSTTTRVIVLVVAVAVVALAAAMLRSDPKPYVVTAIDYHFHDAHPTLPIASGRDLVIKNAGRNVHNVTIPAIDYSENVRPDGQLAIEDIAGRLEPGSYELFCSIHGDRAMTGVIVIAE